MKKAQNRIVAVVLTAFLALPAGASDWWLESTDESPLIQKVVKKETHSGYRVNWVKKHLEVMAGATVDNKTAVNLRHPRMKRAWGKISTASRHGLRVEISGKANQFTPTKIERLGADPEIKRQRGRDIVTFWVREMKEVDTRQLSAVLKEAEASLIESGEA